MRHAEVEKRYQGVFGGQIDMELSPRGHEQAAALAKYLKTQRLDAIYASPMIRVQQTLAPFLAASPCRPIILPDLREVDFGIWTGLSWEEVHAKHGISAFQWLDQLEEAAIPKAENARTFRTRVEPCLKRILAEHPGRQVGIACHGGVIRMLLGILLDLPLRRTAAFEIEYASLTKVALLPHGTQVQLMNFVPWRDSG
jgi:broad specificity phosphatase PhoE